MGSLVVAAALAAGGWGAAVPDGAVVPAGFWPGGGTVWSGTTTYYGFGREVPYGYGIGTPEVFGPYQDFGRNTDVYGPGGYRRPGTGFGSARESRLRGGGWVGGGAGLGRWRR
ncbi:MAG: hypothetical protein K2X87_15630 [Gemmataceae bacterium]|nr:hypothetical protein [Gemmataceae bacterium]